MNLYMIMWKQTNSHTEVLEVWDDKEIAEKRLKKYEKAIKGRSFTQKVIQSLGSIYERVYIEEKVLNQERKKK